MKLYNIALSQEDLIEEMSNVKQLTYYIDGVDLKGIRRDIFPVPTG